MLWKHKRTHPRVMKCLSHPGPGVRHLNAEDKTNQLNEKEKLAHRMAKAMLREREVQKILKTVEQVTRPINPLTNKEYEDPQKEPMRKCSTLRTHRVGWSRCMVHTRGCGRTSRMSRSNTPMRRSAAQWPPPEQPNRRI